MITAILPLIPSIVGFIGRLFRRRKRASSVPDVGDSIDARVAWIGRAGAWNLALLDQDRIAAAYNRATGNQRPLTWWLAWPGDRTVAQALEDDSARLYSWQNRAWVKTDDKTIALRIDT